MTLRLGKRLASLRLLLSNPRSNAFSRTVPSHNTLRAHISVHSSGGLLSNLGYYRLLGITSLLSGGLGYFLSQSTTSNDPRKSEGTISYGDASDFASALTLLRSSFSESQISTDPEVLYNHGFSTYNHHPGRPHAVVVYPRSTEDVVRIVNISRENRIPIVPYAGGTSLEGHTAGIGVYSGVIGPVGSVCIDMSEMDRIIAVHEEDADMVCQAGCTWDGVNHYLSEAGIPLFFPLDPGPSASLGGMMATGCSGTNAVRYGTAKGEWFLNATVVLPSGDVIKTRQRARKSSAGFDVTKLFIGAEGTLGIVTEVTIRLTPLLETTCAVAQFPDVERATRAVRAILNTAVASNIQCIELCDDAFMRATNAYGSSERKYPEVDSLFFKFQGSKETFGETGRLVRETALAFGATGFIMAESEEESQSLWADRKNGLFSTQALRPGAKVWTTDVCVPVSKLPQLVYETKKDLVNCGLMSTVIGHVGDGNFHALIIFDGDEEKKRVNDAVHRMVHRAVALEGTCTGEHGVGLGKKEFLLQELGVGTIELMRSVKAAIDPLNLFNPGKLYPDMKDIKQAKRESKL